MSQVSVDHVIKPNLGKIYISCSNDHAENVDPREICRSYLLNWEIHNVSY